MIYIIYFNDEYKEYVKSNTDLYDSLSQMTDLSDQKGNIVKAICPIPGHNEEDGSLVYYKDKNNAYCYGCNTFIGDSIDLIRLTDNLDFREAVIETAKRNNLELPNQETADKYREELKTKKKLDKTSKYFNQFLYNDKNKNVINYLKNIRGLNDETIDKFNLGFCDFNKKPEFKKFSNRITIPIHDKYDHIVAFSGRVLPEDRGDFPSYINSSDDDFEFFSKRNIIYNLNRAIEPIRKNNYVVWVEGYFDVINLDQYGVSNSVASMGTAITKEQVEEARRYTDNVIIFMDPDDSGKKAMRKSINLFDEYNFNIEIVDNRTGKDPDDLCKEYKDNIINFIKNNSKPYEDYYSSKIIEKYNTERSRIMKRAIKQATAIFKDKLGKIETDIALSSIANTLGVTVENLKHKIKEELEDE